MRLAMKPASLSKAGARKAKTESLIGIPDRYRPKRQRQKNVQRKTCLMERGRFYTYQPEKTPPPLPTRNADNRSSKASWQVSAQKPKPDTKEKRCPAGVKHLDDRTKP